MGKTAMKALLLGLGHGVRHEQGAQLAEHSSRVEGGMGQWVLQS